MPMPCCRWSVTPVLLGLLVAAPVLSAAAEGEAAGADPTRVRVVALPPPAGQQPAPLSRQLELSLVDADLRSALAALNATGLVATAIEGDAPTGTFSLSVRGASVGGVLDALAGLTGLRLERRGDAIIFTSGPPAEIAAARPGGGQGGAGPPPAPAVPQAAAGAQPGRQAVPPGRAVDAAVAMLRDLGLGNGPEPPFSDTSPYHGQAVGRLSGLFTADQRRLMLEAGPEAYRFGIAVRDMPEDLQRFVVDWQGRHYAAHSSGASGRRPSLSRPASTWTR